MSVGEDFSNPCLSFFIVIISKKKPNKRLLLVLFFRLKRCVFGLIIEDYWHDWTTARHKDFTSWWVVPASASFTGLPDSWLAHESGHLFPYIGYWSTTSNFHDLLPTPRPPPAPQKKIINNNNNKIKSDSAQFVTPALLCFIVLFIFLPLNALTVQKRKNRKKTSFRSTKKISWPKKPFSGMVFCIWNEMK